LNQVFADSELEISMGTLCIARDTSSLARTESEFSSAKGTIINQLMKFVA